MWKADLGYQAGTLYSYPNETKEEFEARCYRIAVYAKKGEIKIEYI